MVTYCSHACSILGQNWIRCCGVRADAWVAHALRPPAVSMGDEVAFAEARQRTAEGRAGAGSVGVREQRQWRSEALFAAQHARWAGMVGKVAGEG